MKYIKAFKRIYGKKRCKALLKRFHKTSHYRIWVIRGRSGKGKHWSNWTECVDSKVALQHFRMYVNHRANGEEFMLVRMLSANSIPINYGEFGRSVPIFSRDISVKPYKKNNDYFPKHLR